MEDDIEPIGTHMVVTKAQFDAGWCSFHPGMIPNVQRHRYVALRFLDDGTYVVAVPAKASR